MPAEWSTLLPRYVNGGCLTGADLARSVLSQGWPFRRNARRVAAAWNAMARAARTADAPPVHVALAPYDGTNPHALRMRAYFSEKLSRDVVCACAHGSVGTNEEVGFSDFDALVIVRDEVFAAPRRLARVARALNEARRIMLAFDPIQHHGWFVLAEAQLAAYPESYFPVALFEHARCLFPAEGAALTLRPVPGARERRREAFRRMANAIQGRLQKGRYPTDAYELKMLLSQFMLLPALYVQARDDRGVFKKFSFELARRDFSPEEWAAMDAVSALRRDWSYRLSSTGRRLYTCPSPGWHRLAKRFAPPLPAAMRERLTAAFYADMLRLVALMRRKLDEQGD